ncbi:MAG: type I DNA topoisomerase [Pseudomonadota bacterium]
MSKNLVIVESPAKANTIKKYLGKDYQVLASYGHVRDLIPKEGAVDPDNNFAMTYQLVERNAKHVAQIEKALKSADKLLLATDPDREGEAISWHIYEILSARKKLAKKKTLRVVFHEITKSAIQAAVEHPRDLEMDLIHAQQARRALDYLVGFNLSPLLWRKVRPGLSAGRVQSPALRLIVEREIEIEQFKKQEYWRINAALKAKGKAFSARLVEYQRKKLEQFSITNEKDAHAVKKDLLEQVDGKLEVSHVEKKQRKRHSTAPFITSTMQQEAARKLGFTAQRTMRAAQQLYEAGCITYMRTDSTYLSNEAVTSLRDFIVKEYGKENLPKQARVFKTKTKNAQEAHEAIRPTVFTNIPSQMKLEADQKKLYTLIWKRTVACQMIHALIDTVAIDFSCGEGNRFRSNGSTIASPGFMLVYLEGKDDQKTDQTDDDAMQLPPLEKGELVDLEDIIAQQHFTEPPPRYTEASLIKTLEEYGIGRPSTYASIIATLKARDYVTLTQKRFAPTDVGRVVNKFLMLYFTRYVDYSFTANLEDSLDAVSRGEEKWIPLLEKFWQPFKDKVDDTMQNVKRSDVTQEKIDEKCPKCGSQLAERLGRAGRFIGCTAYPDCDYTRNIDGDKNDSDDSEQLDRQCPECGKPLQIKHGRYGKFIGCSGYPACKHIEPLEKPKDTGVTCPQCHKGTILQRKSRRGKIFYSCSKYPDCKYALWDEPLDEPCPKCEWPILTKKVTKTKGSKKICPQPDCKYSVSLDE